MFATLGGKSVDSQLRCKMHLQTMILFDTTQNICASLPEFELQGILRQKREKLWNLAGLASCKQGSTAFHGRFPV